MHSPQSARVTRQSAVGRFRRERLARRPQDLEERQSMVIAVAERLVTLMQETHDFLDDAHTARSVRNELVRKELASFHLELHEDTIKELSEVRSDRNERAVSDKTKRLDDFDKLKDEVVRIVSADFRGGAA